MRGLQVLAHHLRRHRLADRVLANWGVLNDRLRKDTSLGTAVMTPGIAALGPDAVARIVQTVAAFNDFCHANDPHEEHDFGSFEAEGITIFFKIDYYDRILNHHSPDPADPSVTERVITIMLADEYEAIGFLSPLARGGTTVTLHVYVKDVDAMVARASAAGAGAALPPTKSSIAARRIDSASSSADGVVS
jgi:hypothetical protein